MIAEWLTCKVKLLVYSVILWLINIKPIRYIIRRMASSPGKVTIHFPGYDVWGFERCTTVSIGRCPKCGERQVGDGILWGVYIVGGNEKGEVARPISYACGTWLVSFVTTDDTYIVQDKQCKIIESMMADTTEEDVI